MPRVLSLAVISAAFLAGLFLPDAVGRAVVPPPREPSSVALAPGPESGPPPHERGQAPGGSLHRKADGTLEVEKGELITALDARDPSSLVSAPSLPDSCPPKPCECGEDSLHRYQPKKTRKKDLESLRSRP